MAVDVARLGIKVDSGEVVTASKRLDAFAGSSRRAETATQRLQREARSAARSMGMIIAAGAAATAALSARAIKLAVDAEETAAKFQVVFRGAVQETDEALRDMTETIPLTQSEMRGLAASVQDMIVPLGIAREDAAKLSVTALQLAADIGSFNNTDPAQVLADIQSGLAGSSEPLRKYGIDVREAALQTVALEEGLISSKEEFDQNARAQALFLKITADSSDAMGDAARTADSTANQMRRLARDFRQMQEDLGTYLIPVFREFLDLLNETGGDGTTRAQEGLRGFGQAAMTVISAFLIIIEAGQQLGNILVGLGVAAFNSAKAIAAPFIELNTTVATALESMASGDFSGAAASFDGIFERMANGYSDAAAEAMSGLDFIGEEFTAGVEETLNTVSTLMNAFKLDIKKPLEEAGKGGKKAGADLGKDIGEAIVTGIRKANPRMMAELQKNMDFLDFEGVRRDLEAELKALQGGAEAWEEYGKQQYIAAEVAELGKNATAEQIEEIANMAGEIYELRGAMGTLADVQVTLGDTLQTYGGAFEDMIRSLQAGTKRGTDEYKLMEIAVQATNLVQAVGAILNQAQGDPYTAVPRMAAMASIVSALVGTAISIGGMGGGAPDATAERQASIGTGTVLGSPNEKSESVVNSLEITANATEELVGINRGMHRALMALNDAITGATTVLAGQLDQIDFGPIGDVGIGGYFGGSISVSDTGITVAGGTLSELLEGTLIQAFQEVTEKKHWFDDYDTDRRLEDLSDATQREFSRVFMALVDTVTEAASILGFTQEEIEAALDRFIVYQQDISFEDLNAEEQRAALEAYFSNIFDRLAHEVVPMLEDLQKVGEGMGETLVRVATSIQVFDLALERLPFTFGLTEEMFGSFGDFRYRSIMLKTALVEAAGGLEEFIGKFSEFFDAFASDSQQFSMLFDGLTMQFADMGLTLPATRQGVWDLMAAQDAATASGQAVITMLLELGPEMDALFDAIEDRVETVRDFLDVGPSSGLRTLTNGFREAMTAAQDLGATQAEYALIVRSFERQLDRFVAGLKRQAITLAQSLFGEDGTGVSSEVTSGMDEVRRVTNSVFEDWTRALQGIRAYTDSLMLDENLTTLNPAQQLAESERQFRETLRAAMSGDVEAAGNLPAAAQAFLEEARFMFASGDRYDAIFREVTAALEGVEMPPGIEEYTIEIVRNTDRTANGVNEITRQQNEVIERLDRMIEAMDLASVLGDLGYALDQSPLAIAEELGIPLEGLARALGIDLDENTLETLNGLIGMADMLGADLVGLGDALGVDIEHLADSFGVDLAALDFGTQFMTELETLDSMLAELGTQSNLLRILAGQNPLAEADPGLFGPGTGTDPGGPMPASEASTTTPPMSSEDGEVVITLLTEQLEETTAANARMAAILERIADETEQTKDATLRSNVA